MNSSKYNNDRNLSEVFKELQQTQNQYKAERIKERQAHKNDKTYKIKEGAKEYFIEKYNSTIILSRIVPIIQNYFQSRKYKHNSSNYRKRNYRNNSRMVIHKFNAIGAIIGILFLILFATTIKSNYIFATTREDERKVIGNFEENKNPIDLMNIISTNMSDVEKKDIVTETQIIERETRYIENDQLPKDEEIVMEEGLDGNKEVTYIRSYEKDQLLYEKIINETIIKEPQETVILKGTSEYLLSQNVHIGDTMYTENEVFLMEKPSENSNKICKIYQYIDVKLNEVLGDWCKINVDGYLGYVKKSILTSATNTPEIVEKSRIQRLKTSLKFDMSLNKPSGLTKEDFIRVLSGNSQDTNKIFEENAGLFYELEQKYNVNGILLASIGIHESGWGTSQIAKDKKNLFGYGAYDSSPYESAFDFESYGEGIEILAKVLSKYYLNDAGTPIYDDERATAAYNNGPTLSGINVRYASDPDWAQKVFYKMEMLYNKL